MEQQAQTLNSIRIFADLDQASIDRISSDCHWRTISANTAVLSRGEISDDVMFITSGCLKATVFTSGGKEVTLRELHPGEVFGDYSAIDEKPRSAHVVAMEDSIIASMPGTDFLDVVVRHPCVAIAEMRELTSMVRMMTERVVELSLLQANYRVQLELARLGEKYGRGEKAVTISPPPTYADIASRSATRQEIVASELDRLEELGLISRSSSALVLQDVSVLKLMAKHAVAGLGLARR